MVSQHTALLCLESALLCCYEYAAAAAAAACFLPVARLTRLDSLCLLENPEMMIAEFWWHRRFQNF